jgi:hypothetical protein
VTVERCNAKTRSGGRCGQAAGWGGPTPGFGRCRLHGGMSPSGRKAAERQAAEHAVATFGLPTSIDPRDALHDELARTNGHVLWLGALIADLETGDLKQRALGNDTVLWERPSVWLELYQAERRHLVAVSAAAIKAGVEERAYGLPRSKVR